MNSRRSNEQKNMTDLTSLDGKVAFLRKLPFFINASLETIRLYAYICKTERYNATEPIITQCEYADRMFLIMQGKVAICRESHDRVFHLQMLRDDGINYFGELALLSDFYWFFSAKAVTDVVLLTLSREAFHKIMEKFPETYRETVAKIVRLRITQFVDQADYLLENLKEEAWRECGSKKLK